MVLELHIKQLFLGKKKNYNLCVTMDCDRTHNPFYLKKMLTMIKKDYSIINTNRFKYPNAIKDWPLIRRILTNFRFLLVKLFTKSNLNSQVVLDYIIWIK